MYTNETYMFLQKQQMQAYFLNIRKSLSYRIHAYDATTFLSPLQKHSTQCPVHSTLRTMHCTLRRRRHIVCVWSTTFLPKPTRREKKLLQHTSQPQIFLAYPQNTLAFT
eukprot:GDKI01022943.1.p1 GENE.GDKI01022943.1~~GDKI01022943.1.p1  ORF type:complete len:109 (+),score=2.31 GDKI01022943.1:315-641(+)